MNKLPIKSTDENDCLTKWRQNIFSKRGQVKKAKRRYSKRFRRWLKAEELSELRDNQ